LKNYSIRDIRLDKELKRDYIYIGNRELV